MTSLDIQHHLGARDADPDDDRLIEEGPARELLGGIGHTLFMEHVSRGAIRSAKIGRRRLYSRRSIQTFIRERLAARAE